MKISVYGLWHLGSVTAACLADAGHEVVGIDDDATAVGEGKPIGCNHRPPAFAHVGSSEDLTRGAGQDLLRLA